MPGSNAKNYCEAQTSVYAGPVREHDIGDRIALCEFEKRTPQERIANAQLIAYAPDLLEALTGALVAMQRTLSVFESQHIFGSSRSALEANIEHSSTVLAIVQSGAHAT